MTTLAASLAGTPFRPTAARKLAWSAALVAPLVAGPAWLALMARFPAAGAPLRSAAGLVALLAVAVAFYTDLRWRRIPNWVTYPAALWGLGLAALGGLAARPEWAQTLSGASPSESLAGFAVLLVSLLVVFSFTGGGAGDVKLAAALGALLGIEVGVQALLYSFVAAGVVTAAWAIFTHGPLAIAASLGSLVGSWFLPLWVPPPSESQRRLLRTPVPMGPSFALGTVCALAQLRPETLLPNGLF